MLTSKEAKEISITQYLSLIGFEASKVRGDDHWYISPFRNERTPSFKVNTKMNVWFDHGIGEGGTLIDLGIKIHQCDTPTFIAKLSKGNFNSLAFNNHPIKKELEKKIEIVSLKQIQEAGLVRYLKSRGIDLQIAKEFCFETEFKIGVRKYLAIAFPNQSNAFELRNSWFKGSSSPKDVSLVKGQSADLYVLEGFFDFLSIHQLRRDNLNFFTKDTNFLILNSISLLARSIPILESYKNIYLFMDNDSAGKKTSLSLERKGIAFKDMSYLYAPHKDLNDFLQSKKAITVVSNKKNKGFSI